MSSLYSDTLCEVPRLVYVAAELYCDVIAQELEGNGAQYGHKCVVGAVHLNHIFRHSLDLFIASGDDGNDPASSGFHFLNVGNNLFFFLPTPKKCCLSCVVL